MAKTVKIVIPIYTSNLSVLELQSLKRIYSVMNNYDIVAIKPESLNVSSFQKEFPKIKFESFQDYYFAGREGYNRLMLSTDLYKRFLDVDYMLICQLDVYIFRDTLSIFLEKDYDYIGAPYLKRRLYRVLPIMERLKTSKKKYDRSNITWVQNVDNKVGNGGFSLRKVKSFYDMTIKYADRIAIYNSFSNTSLYHEDTFWSKEPLEFNYPTVEEALRFSFDKYPKLCYRENQKQLPMGCHAWYKWKWRSFWKKFIAFEDQNENYVS